MVQHDGMTGLPPILSARSNLGRWKKCRKEFQKNHKASFDGLIIKVEQNTWYLLLVLGLPEPGPEVPISSSDSNHLITPN
jgi:hypothetical protein